MNMRIFKLAAISTVLLGCTAANAANAADLTVKGTIAVPGCTVSSDMSGVYDYGPISSSLIQPGTTTTALVPMGNKWTASCSAQTSLTFTVIDNRASSASVVAPTNFGLGNVNGTGKLGYYTVTLSSPTVDGQAVSTFATTGATFTAVSSTPLSTDKKFGWASGNNVLRTGKVFGAMLAVTPNLGGTTTMGGALSNGANLDGSLTLNFAFGL